jgi:ACS family tartrate transporter-like MFS transporter
LNVLDNPTNAAGEERAAGGDARQLERTTMHRVTYRIMPFIMLCYFVAYLDRVNVGFAALQMNKALGLNAAAFGLGAGLFFVGYCICEVPSNLLLYKFGARRWIARIMFTWGLCAAGMAFIGGEKSFYVLRTLLGMAEAGFQPGVLFFLTLWFPEAYRGRVLGMFLAAIPISGIIGAPVSGLLLSLDGYAGLQGWQWLYLLEAAPALLLAPIVAFYLQDSPSEARWLPVAGRDWLVGQMGREKQQREAQRTYSVRQALTNPAVLFLAAIYFTNVCLNNGIAFFLPQIIKGFGLSNGQTGLVAAIPSALALVAVIWLGKRSDTRQERYGHAALANLVGGLALLASALLHDPVARVAALAIALSGTLSFSAVFWAIPGSFLSGLSAAGGIAAISAIGVTGGFVAPWFVGYLKDVTGDFRWGLGLVGCLAIVAAAALYAFGRRRHANVMSHVRQEASPAR